jgi:hypothetical protein
LAILEAIDGMVQIVGHSIEGLAGWRYLLSPIYRRTVHARWAQMSRLAVVGEVVIFLVSFIFVTLVIGGGLWLLIA